jgi:hypothetical protein
MVHGAYPPVAVPEQPMVFVVGVEVFSWALEVVGIDPEDNVFGPIWYDVIVHEQEIVL